MSKNKSTTSDKKEVKQTLRTFVVDVDGVKHVVEAVDVASAVKKAKSGDKE